MNTNTMTRTPNPAEEPNADAFCLITTQRNSPPKIRHFNTVENLIAEIGYCLTWHVCICDIWHDGCWFVPRQIEALKIEALKGLGPISKAKAMRNSP